MKWKIRYESQKTTETEGSRGEDLKGPDGGLKGSKRCAGRWSSRKRNATRRKGGGVFFRLKENPPTTNGGKEERGRIRVRLETWRKHSKEGPAKTLGNSTRTASLSKKKWRTGRENDLSGENNIGAGEGSTTSIWKKTSIKLGPERETGGVVRKSKAKHPLKKKRPDERRERRCR